MTRNCHDDAVRIVGVTATAFTLALTACTSSSTPPRPTSSPPTASTIRVSCSSPDGTAVAGDQPTVRARATALGAQVVAVRSSSATLQVDVRGIPEDEAHTLCASPAVRLRGVIAPAVHVTCAADTCAAGSVTDALRAAHVDPPPLTEASYSALSPAQRHRIAAALARFDCSSVQHERDDPASYFVGCGTGAAYFLGPAIVSGTDVAQATAARPDGAHPEWRINLDLTTAGAAAWAQYTGAHNSNGTPPSVDVTSCSLDTTPCATWVAFVVDGNVVSAPYSIEAITGGTTQITGQFDGTEAKRIAALLDSALSVPLHVDSVQVVH